MKLLQHNVLHMAKRGIAELPQEALAVANKTVAEILAPSLVRRTESSSATTSCSANDNRPICQKPTDTSNSSALTIGLGAGIPCAIALLVLIFLHRRIRRKQRLEDSNDKHASLDFGLDAVHPNSKARGPKTTRKDIPEMTITDTEKTVRRGNRGMSMDLGSPYLLPGEVHQSRESFHSMSRSMTDQEDPYRPVTFIKSDTDSYRPRKGSTYTGSTKRSNDSIDMHLYNNNATNMSRLDVKSYDPTSPASYETYDIPANLPARDASLQSPSPASDQQPFLPAQSPPPTEMAPAYFPPRKESAQQPYEPQAPPKGFSPPPPPAPPVHEPTQHSRDESNYGDFDFDANAGFEITPPSPPRHQAQEQQQAERLSLDAPAPPAHRESLAPQNLPLDNRRVSVMGLRPLPPDDPTDNPEQRANRIRSFYKEYFDESKPNPKGYYPQQPMYEDDGGEYYDDGAMYDPETGAFYSTQAPPPFAQPIGRRAMTPPPRGAAQVGHVHRSHASIATTGRMNNGPARPAQPKKKAPPPIALTSLPTPHMLRDDTISPISFAPPASFRDRGYGRAPDSPTGIARPFSPAVPIHLPLATSYDDLSVMPSPHLLRKSGTFTALDFAPPPRFKNSDGASSDAGSIRSNRSGISAVQREALRQGAYRVSRIPKEFVGTRDDFSLALKPSWDMRD